MKKYTKMIMACLFTFMSAFTFLKADASNIAANKARYEAITKEVIQAVVSENTNDIQALTNKLEEATNIGLQLAQDVSAANPDGKPLLDFLSANVNKIKAENLTAIESNWHHGGAFKAAGIKHDEFDHYGSVIGAKDAVIHPLTALIALKEYQKTQNKDLLATAQAELEEILGQLQYIN